MLTLVDERERKAEGSGQTLCVVKGEKNILKYMTIVPAHLMGQAVVPAPGSSAFAGYLGRTDRRRLRPRWSCDAMLKDVRPPGWQLL